MSSFPTAVIITAKDAAETIGKAVRSALAQEPVVEVIVVDDGSSDTTSATAQREDDGTGRLKLLRFETNRGPSSGRNAARDAATAPFLCVLDADDFMGEGRLEALYRAGGEDWDLLADDMLFVREPDEGAVFDHLLAPDFPLPHALTLAGFAQGNIPDGRSRRELGFLKPVMRRSFLDEHAIRYDERLRLGEDFLVYAQSLADGARFKLVPSCGYYAVQYPNSLSARHRTADLDAFYRALEAFLEGVERRGQPAGRLRDYVWLVRRRLALRQALDAKHERGLAGVASAFRAHPGCVPFVLKEVLRAKLSAWSPRD
jgi:succinoglycan biosynthesis protein ExoU